MVKSPFVHAKSKEVFEKRTFTRSIQLYDAHPLTVRDLTKYVNARLPEGVDMEVDLYEYVGRDAVMAGGEIETVEFEGDGLVVGLVGGGEESFHKKVRDRAREILAQLGGGSRSLKHVFTLMGFQYYWIDASRTSSGKYIHGTSRCRP
jgi:hypothetical protein